MKGEHGFVPHEFEYVSDQPYLEVTGFTMANPLISKILLEVGLREHQPTNVMAKQLPSILEMPNQGMFYHSPLNGIRK